MINFKLLILVLGVVRISNPCTLPLPEPEIEEGETEDLPEVPEDGGEPEEEEVPEVEGECEELEVPEDEEEPEESEVPEDEEEPEEEEAPEIEEETEVLEVPEDEGEPEEEEVPEDEEKPEEGEGPEVEEETEVEEVPEEIEVLEDEADPEEEMAPEDEEKPEEEPEIIVTSNPEPAEVCNLYYRNYQWALQDCLCRPFQNECCMKNDNTERLKDGSTPFVPLTEELCKSFIPRKCRKGVPVVAQFPIPAPCGCNRKPGSIVTQRFDSLCHLLKFAAENRKPFLSYSEADSALNFIFSHLYYKSN